MNIGIVSYDYAPPIGGLGVMVESATALLQRLHPTHAYHVISPSRNAPPGASRLARMRWGKAGGCPLFSLTLLWSLPRSIRILGLDTVHVHSGSGGVFLLRRPACRLIVTAHHTYAQEARTVFAGSPVRKFWKTCMARLEKRTYRFADLVICVSEDTRRELVDTYKVPEERTVVVENFIDVDAYAPLADAKRRTDVILFVGRLEPRKGIMVLLDAFRILKEKQPGLRLRLVGANLMGDTLTASIKRLGLEPSVDMPGRIDEPLLRRELGEAAVIAVPSIIEGFGLIAAQAMAAGVCVVASDCPGLRSVVSHQKTGLLFPTGNAKACADALGRILADTALRMMLCNAALTDARNRFRPELHVKRIQNCYEICIDSGSFEDKNAR